MSKLPTQHIDEEPLWRKSRI